MLSVTQRIKSVSQPRGGYVPKSLFTVETYNDFNELKDVNVTLSSIQGMAVDYLTRFMITKDKVKSFAISIEGAKKIDDAYENDNEIRKVLSLLDKITGLDRESVINACKIVCYDSAFRMGLKSYQPAEDVEFSDELFENIPILVNRCLLFIEKVGPIIKDEVTFEGGYTALVSSGDGDYLTQNVLIDLKVSKNAFSIKWSLQLLMYYILGIHSIYKEFLNIKKLCIFNPIKNKSYICNINDISNETKFKVSHDVLGYKMSDESLYMDDKYNKTFDYSVWRQVDGTDMKILQQFLTDNFKKTGFDVEKYGNGIYEITTDDYWTFLLSNFKEYENELRPLFTKTKKIKMIKRNGYFMFVSVSDCGKYSILHGARLHALTKTLDYYYDNIEKYATTVVMRFYMFWDVLKEISKQIQNLKPSEKFLRSKYSEYLDFQKFLGKTKKECMSYSQWYEKEGCRYNCSGKVHGCIVDIDFFNHIYVNPYDGKVTPYNAASMYDKNIYKNVRSLLAARKPEILPAFDNLIKTKKTNIITDLLVQEKDSVDSFLVPKGNEIYEEYVKVYETNMYNASNKLKPLQNIYDLKLVQMWYDDFLNDSRERLESEKRIDCKNTSVKKKVVCQKRKYENKKYVEKKQDKPKMKIRDKYIGIKKQMKCGLQATVIDYKDCKNLTIQFEDGFIKTGVRSDHFMNGKVGRY